MAGKFDLLETNLGGLGDGLVMLEKDEKVEKLLIWQKLEVQGFQPPARHVSSMSSYRITCLY
ncbi:hypothetical protein EON65_40415 [archaeon]|nr:MAG: hypothetical protein EON65_40415 [archaeon]